VTSLHARGCMPVCTSTSMSERKRVHGRCVCGGRGGEGRGEVAPACGAPTWSKGCMGGLVAMGPGVHLAVAQAAVPTVQLHLPLREVVSRKSDLHMVPPTPRHPHVQGHTHIHPRIHAPWSHITSRAVSTALTCAGYTFKPCPPCCTRRTFSVMTIGVPTNAEAPPAPTTMSSSCTCRLQQPADSGRTPVNILTTTCWQPPPAHDTHLWTEGQVGRRWVLELVPWCSGATLVCHGSGKGCA
jgi:hypothetical protein